MEQIVILKLIVVADDKKGEKNPFVLAPVDSLTVSVASLDQAIDSRPQEFGSIVEDNGRFKIEKYVAMTTQEVLDAFHSVQAVQMGRGDAVLKKWRNEIVKSSVKPSWGGVRPGSGRKKIKEKKVATSIRLSAEVLQNIKKEAKMGNESLTAAIERRLSDGTTAQRKSTRGYRLGIVYGTVVEYLKDVVGDQAPINFDALYDDCCGPMPSKLALALKQLAGRDTEDGRIAKAIGILGPDDLDGGPLLIEDQADFALGVYHRLPGEDNY